MIKQAIIPLAGLGTRLLPLTSVFAKELLPINGKPGIEYILDECVQAGIKEIVFIISKKKNIIKNSIKPILSIEAIYFSFLSSFKPCLNDLIPLAISPATFGNLPAPKNIKTITRIRMISQ